MTKLKVVHIPQVPMKGFEVEVSSVEEGVKVMNILANYDLFQLENNIKPDYFNVSFLQMYDETLTDQDLIEMELEDRWVDWYFESDTDAGYFYFEDPRDYVEDFGAGV